MGGNSFYLSADHSTIFHIWISRAALYFCLRPPPGIAPAAPSRKDTRRFWLATAARENPRKPNKWTRVGGERYFSGAVKEFGKRPVFYSSPIARNITGATQTKTAAVAKRKAMAKTGRRMAEQPRPRGSWGKTLASASVGARDRRYR